MDRMSLIRQPRGLSLIALLVATSLPLLGQRKIAEVHVRGSRRFSAHDVIAASGLRAGAPYSAAAVERAARRLADTGAFSEVSPMVVPAYSSVILDWYLTDAPRFVPARFAGFTGLSQAQLEDAAHQVPLFHGELPLLKPGLADQVAAALQSLLEAHHLSGRVEHRFAGHGGDIESVVFRVVK